MLLSTRIRNAILLSASFIFSPIAESVEKEATTYTYDTVAMYGEYQDRAVRWADGLVRVYDESNILKESPAILEYLNRLTNRVSFVLTDNKDSALIQIQMTDALPAPYSSACAITLNTLGGDNGSFIRSNVKIKKGSSCFTKQPDALMFHEFGHVLGFSRHSKAPDVMSIHDPYYTDAIPIEVLSRFVYGLYRLDPGADIPLDRAMPWDSELPLFFVRKKEPFREDRPLKWKFEDKPIVYPTLDYDKHEIILPDGRKQWVFTLKKKPAPK
jgi:hypothetical protein